MKCEFNLWDGFVCFAFIFHSPVASIVCEVGHLYTFRLATHPFHSSNYFLWIFRPALKILTSKWLKCSSVELIFYKWNQYHEKQSPLKCITRRKEEKEISPTILLEETMMVDGFLFLSEEFSNNFQRVVCCCFFSSSYPIFPSLSFMMHLTQSYAYVCVEKVTTTTRKHVSNWFQIHETIHLRIVQFLFFV